MVKINRTSRRQFLALSEKFQSKNQELVTRQQLHIFLLAVIASSVAAYFLFLSWEEAAAHGDLTSDLPSRNGAGIMVSALPVKQLVEKGKPFLMYGTAWKKEHTARLVSEAVHNGFRFIDTACQPKHYNEPGVGAGWKSAATELGLERSDIFLQTKYTSIGGQDPNNIPYNQHLPPKEQVHESLAVSLKNLRTDYLDSLVMHSPMDTFDQTMEVWREFESFVDKGTVHMLGISNCYDFDFFTRLYREARIKPSVLQNRFYDESNFDTELRKFCQEKGIWYQSFWTLTANRHALASPEVKKMASEKGLTPQTLMYAFMMSLGYPKPLDGTTNTHHMMQDIAIMERLQNGEKIFADEDELRLFAQRLGMPDL